MSDNEGDQGPKSTFCTYMAEGDQLYHKGEYVKFIHFFQTLILQPDDKNGLVARSKCYVKMRDCDNALRDAEASLYEDKSFLKGAQTVARAAGI
uniref:Uncharacterized protein n=1 Tax=Oncorhynchus mykiss TaxID=8022 RepID=A0A8C7NHZ0_ONCMY